MPRVTEALIRFLRARLDSHPGRDLLERYLALGGPTALETQVNVAAGNGEPVEGRRNTYTDGVNTWWNVRIPKNANADPEWDDYELTYAPEEHAEGIGSTGWRWSTRRSLWVGFDFDSLVGHAKGIGVTDEELARVCEAAKAIPYVEVRRSTGGKGVHFYVYFDGDGIPTENHTVHAGLARAVLGMMSSEAGFDFASQIDVCGHVMWLWHRKTTPENQGLSLLKPAEKTLTAADLPANWRDHVEVVTRRRTKVRIAGITEMDPFEALASARRIIPLDEKHKAIIEVLMQSGYSTLWVQDHHLLQTHTKAVQGLVEDATTRNRLGLIGSFRTISEGKDRGTPNCFLFPLLHGGWKVYRFSQGINEAETWTQDGNGWTTCYFNRLPDFETACRANGGVKDPETGLYVFDNATAATKAADMLGQKIKIEEGYDKRETRLKVSKDGKLIVLLQRERDDVDKLAGWVNKKDRWVREYDKRIEDDPSEELGFDDFDEALRSLITPAGDSAGWVIKTEGGIWTRQPGGNVKMVLQNSDISKNEAEAIMGGAVKRSWKLVNMPFHPEYPGGRQWNLDAAQFKVKPAELAPGDQPHHPHWDLLYRHIGTDLDAAIRESPQMQRLNIRTGAQYLLLWLACMFREPFEPLPYLFLFGSENCGKSIFHESLSEVLVTKGIVPADRALTNGNEFNGELANAILCVIEEKNVAASPVAYARIKEWVTCRILSIRKMRTDSYTQPNTTHWVQIANHQDHCPVFPGDTRITVICVPDLLSEQDIPKKKLIAKLQEEAPHFLYTLLNIELPPVEGRLRLPVVTTAHKLRSEEFHKDELQQFMDECCFWAPGEKLLFKDFYDKFYQWLSADQKGQWSRQQVNKTLPIKYPTWNGSCNKKFIGNLSFTQPAAIDAMPIVVINGKPTLGGEEA